MKKIISLGGNFYQMTAVKAAKKMGIYVIDVDYLPDNPAHRYADEYYNISITEKEQILELAKELQVDGIISYASDVGAPTAAYVAEKMGLPTNSYETVFRMTRKDLFHPFLKKNGFFIPDVIQIRCKQDVYDFFEKHDEILLKPVNSSGSKGITKITSRDQIDKAFDVAVEYSRDSVLVAEEFIGRDYYQIAGDAFVVNGKIAYFGVANEHFNVKCNPLVPVGESFPADISNEKKEQAKQEIQRAITCLGIQNGAINLDFMFDKKGNIFIIELGPRNGGNLITDAICLGSGVDLAEYTIMAALDMDLSSLKEREMDKYVASYIFHSMKDGIYDEIELSEMMKKKIVSMDMFIEKGEVVHRFENGGFGIGAGLLEFDSREEMLYMMDNMNDYYTVKLKR